MTPDRPKPWLRAATPVLVAACLLAPLDSVSAQSLFPQERLPALPDFTPAEEQPGRLLPPVTADPASAVDRLAGGLRITPRTIHLRDNTVLDPDELARITAPYLNREIGFAELQALREALTRAYLERGYITSGVLLPEQVVRDGRIEYQAVEGRLREVRVETDGGFEPDYFAARLRRSAEPVINLARIEERLQVLQQDDRIASIEARLAPSATLGRADLDVSVRETPPLRLSLGVDNHTAPAIGAEGVWLRAGHHNLDGRGARLLADLRVTEGLEELGLEYRRPLNSRDTQLRLHARGSESKVVDDEFDDLDIESESQTLGLTLAHPLRQDRLGSTQVSGGLEARRSRSFLLGSGFSFAEGPEEGRSAVTALRLGTDWLRRNSRRVSAARLQLSVGLDALDATRHDDDRPDGRFTSLLAQLQWARRFAWNDTRVILRGDLQLSDDRLLGMEQFSIGGHASVRGYREHYLVRDQGLFGSIETRIGLWRSAGSPSRLDLALFADAGYGRNHDADQGDNLYSTGAGLLGALGRNWHYSLYLAHRGTRVQRSGEYDLQDDGIHFQLSYRLAGGAP